MRASLKVSRGPLPLLLVAVLGTVSDGILGFAPGRGGLDRVVFFHTTIAFVSLHLGRAAVAFLIKRMLLDLDPTSTLTKDSSVLGLETAQALREIVPCEVLGALQASPAECDHSAHGKKVFGGNSSRDR